MFTTTLSTGGAAPGFQNTPSRGSYHQHSSCYAQLRTTTDTFTPPSDHRPFDKPPALHHSWSILLSTHASMRFKAIGVSEAFRPAAMQPDHYTTLKHYRRRATQCPDWKLDASIEDPESLRHPCHLTPQKM